MTTKEQLIATGLHPDTATEAARILAKKHRTQKEQAFISELWPYIVNHIKNK